MWEGDRKGFLVHKLSSRYIRYDYYTTTMLVLLLLLSGPESPSSAPPEAAKTKILDRPDITA